MHKALVTIALAALLAACSSTAEPGAADTRPPGSGPGDPANKAVSAAAAVAISTVAKQTGAPPEQISIRSEAAVQFSDSSLGCPKPGMAYLLVITPGYKILAEYGGKVYDVRVAGNRGLLCDRQKTNEKIR
jgi:hypothetical protein